MDRCRKGPPDCIFRYTGLQKLYQPLHQMTYIFVISGPWTPPPPNPRCGTFSLPPPWQVLKVWLVTLVNAHRRQQLESTHSDVPCIRTSRHLPVGGKQLDTWQPVQSDARAHSNHQSFQNIPVLAYSLYVKYTAIWHTWTTSMQWKLRIWWTAPTTILSSMHVWAKYTYRNAVPNVNLTSKPVTKISGRHRTVFGIQMLFWAGCRSWSHCRNLVKNGVMAFCITGTGDVNPFLVTHKTLTKSSTYVKFVEGATNPIHNLGLCSLNNHNWYG